MATSIYSEFSFETLTFKQLPLKRSSFGRQRESLRVASKASRRRMCWSDKHFWWLLWLMTHRFFQKLIYLSEMLKRVSSRPSKWKVHWKVLLNDSTIIFLCCFWRSQKSERTSLAIAPGWLSQRNFRIRLSDRTMPPPLLQTFAISTSLWILSTWLEVDPFLDTEDLVPLVGIGPYTADDIVWYSIVYITILFPPSSCYIYIYATLIVMINLLL